MKGGCSQLARDCDIDLDGESVTVCVFPMMVAGDIPQQASNSAFLRYTATYGCRQCFCPATEKYNLEFGIVQKGRYHWQTIQDWETARLLRGAKPDKFLRDKEMMSDEPVLTLPSLRLNPILLIQSKRSSLPLLSMTDKTIGAWCWLERVAISPVGSGMWMQVLFSKSNETNIPSMHRSDLSKSAPRLGACFSASYESSELSR